jgi:hypothetical protein
VIPIVRYDYEARVRGSVVRQATCEECGTEHVYRVERETRARAYSAYL